MKGGEGERKGGRQKAREKECEERNKEASLEEKFSATLESLLV